LNTFIETSANDIQNVLNLQNGQGKWLKSQLNDITSGFVSNTSCAEQLAEARELNGRLQEKLSATEVALCRACADCNNLKSQEAILQEQITSLEADVALFQKHNLDADRVHDSSNHTPELQVQLGTTPVVLTEESEKLKAREIEIRDTQHTLNETKLNLERANIQIVSLEAEKIALQENAREIERKVREELVRASLTSKDQNRAWFEQELHKLKREKLIAEQDVEKIKEQLESTKYSLV
jgi:hypothetical protein